MRTNVNVTAIASVIAIFVGASISIPTADAVLDIIVVMATVAHGFLGGTMKLLVRIERVSVCFTVW